LKKILAENWCGSKQKYTMKKESKIKAIAIFEGKQIRRHWDAEKELWYFAIMDVVQILAQTDRPRKYWNDLKSKLKYEGSELSEKIGQLKIKASDGKKYLTDVADTEVMLRLVRQMRSLSNYGLHVLGMND